MITPRVMQPPSSGLNLTVGPGEAAPDEATVLVNLLPDRGGVKVRKGHAQYAEGIASGIRQVFGFKGTSVGENRLFATDESGIYDITGGGTIGAAVVTFPTVSNVSGRGVAIPITTIGGSFLAYIDEENGYYLYTSSTDSWSKIIAGAGAGQINGADPADFVHGVLSKERLWFVLKNSGISYYLPVGQLTGTVVEFNFGNKFPNGGQLVGLYQWSSEGAASNEDRLVGISSSGGIVVYEGSNPDSADTWRSAGVWSVGDLPYGRHIAEAYGGDLYILCSFGLLPISRLLRGGDLGEENVYTTWKIGPAIRDRIAAYGNLYGWEIRFVPSEGLLFISTPAVSGSYVQYVQGLNRQAWTVFEDIPYETGCYYDKTFYFGDSDGNIWTYTGSLDGRLLDGTGYSEIAFQYVSGFQLFESQQNKQIHIVRPTFISVGIPGVALEIVYDFAEPSTLTPEGAVEVSGSAVWDTAIWDTDLWFGGRVVYAPLIGASGLGIAVALQIAGNANGDCTYVRSDLFGDAGGLL